MNFDRSMTTPLTRLVRTLRPATLAFVATVAAASCLHNDQAPAVNPNNTLSLDKGMADAHISDQPFGVVFGSPQGETSDAAEISLVFNRPMRPLDLAGDEAPAPATISPEVPGHWRWIGTSGLYFAPEGHLPKATAYVVTVPAGTKALDGSVLSEPFRMEFSTQRPALVNTSPWEGATGLQPNARFTLRFNQSVANAEIKRAVQLTAGQGKASPIPFEVRRPDADNPKLAEIVPSKPLPLASPVFLSVDESLRGVEGPLSANKSSFYKYQTYGPLSVSDVHCPRDTPHGKCAPRNSVSIGLTNPVSYADAKKAITITPAIKLRWWEGAGDDYETSRIRLDASFRPAGKYTVRIRGTLKDKYGQALGRDKIIQLDFDDLWPQAEIGVRGTYFEPKVARDIAIATVNVQGMDLLTAPLSQDAVAKLTQSDERKTFNDLVRLSGAKVARVHPTAAPNLMAKQIVRPSQVLGGANKRGPMLIATQFTQRPGTRDARPHTDWEVVQVTDLGISAKLSRFDSLVWVNRLSDGKPVEGAEIRIRRPSGNSQNDFVTKTDANGMAAIDGAILYPNHRQQTSPLIIVSKGEDWAYRSASDILYGWRYGVSTDLYGELAPFGMVFTERGMYRPGDTVKLKGILRKPEAKGTSTPAGQSAKVKITTATGDSLVDRTVVLSEFGTFALDAKVPRTAPLGSYQVNVTVGTGDHTHTWGSFEVAEYRASEFKVRTELDKRSYIRGDDVTCAAHGDYLFGAPMSNAGVRTTITRGPSWFSVPDTDDFTTADYAFERDRDEGYIDASQLQAGEGTLDGKGRHQLSTKLALPACAAPNE